MLEIVLFCVNFGRDPRVDLRPALAFLDETARHSCDSVLYRTGCR